MGEGVSYQDARPVNVMCCCSTDPATSTTTIGAIA